MSYPEQKASTCDNIFLFYHNYGKYMHISTHDTRVIYPTIKISRINTQLNNMYQSKKWNL